MREASMLKFLSIFILITTILCADIMQLKTMKDVETIVADADQDTLVVFDIDDTLTFPGDPAFDLPNLKKYRHIMAPIKENWTPHHKLVAINLMAIDEALLLDSDAPALIQALQERGVPTIALTAIIAGKIEDREDMNSLRKKQLAQHQIDFSKTAPHTDRMIFDQLKSFLNHHPVSEHGIIVANGIENSKGEVLLEYLKLCNHNPKKIIFIDDTLKHVESMVEPLKQQGIEYTGIHFTYDLPQRPVEEDQMLKMWTEIDRLADQVIEERQNNTSNFTVRIDDKIESELSNWLVQGLKSHAEEHGVLNCSERFSVEIFDNGQRIAAASGKNLFGSLFIDLVYISENYRGQGIGRMLMEKAFEVGKNLNCPIAVVETMSFQAVEFYQKLGFTIDFAREGYRNNSTLYSMQRKL